MLECIQGGRGFQIFELADFKATRQQLTIITNLLFQGHYLPFRTMFRFLAECFCLIFNSWGLCLNIQQQAVIFKLKSLFKNPKCFPQQRSAYCHFHFYYAVTWIVFLIFEVSKAYSEPCQTSKMDRFVKIANSFSRQLPSILDIWQFFEYVFYHTHCYNFAGTLRNGAFHN